MRHGLTVGFMSLGGWCSDDSSLCRLKMRQRRGKTNSFERSRRCAAQKPCCHPSCRLHDNNGSEIPLTLLLSACQGKGRRDLTARRHSTAESRKWQEQSTFLFHLNVVHSYRHDCPQRAVIYLITPISDIKTHSGWSWQFTRNYSINRVLIST